MIPVARPYLPSRENLNRYIDRIYHSKWLTNDGSLVQELTKRLESYLGVENLLLVANGTLALQVAYRALGLHYKVNDHIEAITTPFTFVATASALRWEGINPVFSDIDQDSWCLDTNQIEQKISSATRALVPVHVFGNPCDVESLQSLAERYNLKIIYDSAHAFGVSYKGSSLLNWGDASVLSFHATKLFHTIEGGAIVFKQREHLERARKLINFGITAPESIEELGINGKMNEFEAAMGLCLLDEIDGNLRGRKQVWETYQRELGELGGLQKWHPEATQNHAYFPLMLPSEQDAIDLKYRLERAGICSRRYFYPPLHRLPFLQDAGQIGKLLPNADDIARRVICLPLFHDLDPDEILMHIK